MPQARFLIALGRAALYIFAMSDSNKNNFEIELKRLERQVDELIALLGQMREENRALRQRQESLATDRSSLVQKNEQVRTRVEAMIGRLKMLEHGA
jgi:cell division protein ZapB